MSHEAYWLGVASGILVVAVVVEMVRRRYLRGRYAVVWVLFGAAAVTFALFPDLLGMAARATGVEVPLNLLFFLGSLAMLIMLMQLSAEAGRLQERTRVLAEEVALLRAAIHRVDESDCGHGAQAPESWGPTQSMASVESARVP
jgi:hypothetical protein